VPINEAVVIIMSLNMQVVPCSGIVVWCTELRNWCWCLGDGLRLCRVASSSWFFVYFYTPRPSCTMLR